MGLRIQTNVEAFRSYRNLSNTTNAVAKSMEKLSSGYRINRAADDASGLAISEKLKAQIGGLQQAQRNVGDANALLGTGEGSLDQVHAMLQRVRELAVKYNNDTLGTSDKAAITAEVAQLSAEITRIAAETKFNGIPLLSGSAATLTFQVGADAGQVIAITVSDLMGTGTDQIDNAAFSFGTTADIALLDTAISNVSARRASFGAIQNRLEYSRANMAIYEENLSDSLSRIKDVDMAAEMVNYTKLQILQQSGTAMLAQANQSPQGVLSLLQ
jgi:flagellin